MHDHVIHRYHTAFLRMRDAEKAAGQKEFDAGGTGPAMGFGGGSLGGEALGESPRGFKAGNIVVHSHLRVKRRLHGSMCRKISSTRSP